MKTASKPGVSPQLQHPELWNLLLGIDETQLNYLLYSPAQDNSLITGTVPLSDTQESYLKAVENAVYDTPLLLDDYRSVRLAVRSSRFIVLPAGAAADEALMAQAFAAAMPDAQGDITHCQLPANDVDIAFELPKGMLSFLQRTFNMPVIVHHLYAHCEHALKLNSGSDTARMHLHVGEHTIDVAVFRGDKLQLANSFTFDDVNDAAYFALHVWKTCRLNSQSHEAIVTGNAHAQRDALTATLRRYITYVMPGILPAAALRLGDNAHQAPTDLILLSLCE